GPLQLQLRSTGADGAGPGRSSDAFEVCGRRQTGRDDAQRIGILHVVERWDADDGVLPQHDRSLDRGDRESDTDRDPAGSGKAAADRRYADAHSATEVALREVDRIG